jgi:hypothetical protein
MNHRQPRSIAGLVRTLAAGVLFGAAANACAVTADELVGRWKLVSHISQFGGQRFDSHAALLQQRPCAAAFVYELKADKSYRLDASASTCDARYKKTQERLYAKTQWRLAGNRLTTSATNFAAGQTYTVAVSGNRMTWVGTDGQGTLVYQK